MLALQEQLEKQLPGYKDSLRTIHILLKNNADLVHVLNDEQIGVIVSGLGKHKGLVIAKAVAKGAGKKAKQLTIDDI